MSHSVEIETGTCTAAPLRNSWGEPLRETQPQGENRSPRSRPLPARALRHEQSEGGQMPHPSSTLADAEARDPDLPALVVNRGAGALNWVNPRTASAPTTSHRAGPATSSVRAPRRTS